ncbi:MAG: toll/interleukin-1 receptor domain-containing protein [Planctomycetes bacterium]|nr:toll/interleukin-1 receptor domain-containing protein [Planctomycetota bacterium]
MDPRHPDRQRVSPDYAAWQDIEVSEIQEPNQPSVFISYADGDKATAQGVCSTLEAAGVPCWIAPRNVPPGAEWAPAIAEAIPNAKVMVVVLSTHANESRHVKREVERAVTHGLVIIPFRIEDVALSASLEFYLTTVHRLDAFTPPLEEHLHRLAETVAAVLQT